MALKRQQAAEDAIAIGLRAIATGRNFGYLPPGPIFGGGPPSDSRGEFNRIHTGTVQSNTPKGHEENTVREKSCSSSAGTFNGIVLRIYRI